MLTLEKNPNSAAEKFHVCATCIHFSGNRENGKMIYRCTRLGYDTRPEYKFNCWTPKPHIKELIEKRSIDKQ